MIVLRIRDWDRHYENNRTREMKRMSWVPIRNRLDSDGYVELLDHADGAAHFGCWIACVEAASNCQPRGTLLRDSGTTHDAKSLARLTRIPEQMMQVAIQRLLRIGWLEATQEGAAIPQETAVEGAGSPQESALYGREGTEQKEPISSPPAPVAPEPAAELVHVKTSASDVVAAWNRVADRHGLPKVRAGGQIDAKIRPMLREEPDLAVIEEAMGLFAAQTFVIEQRYGLGNFLPNRGKYLSRAAARDLNGHDDARREAARRAWREVPAE